MCCCCDDEPERPHGHNQNQYPGQQNPYPKQQQQQQQHHQHHQHHHHHHHHQHPHQQQQYPQAHGQPFPAPHQQVAQQQQHGPPPAAQNPYQPRGQIPPQPVTVPYMQPFRPAVPNSGRRKALMIGINYSGTKAELRGCIPDVHNLHELLTQTMGWNPQSIQTLTDDGKGTTREMPTKANIMKWMKWLTADARPGDVLFFSFSGHGAQDVDEHGIEEDGMNETICPSDFQKSGMISDNTLAATMVVPLPEGVRLTCILDACHSGTGLDLAWQRDKARGQWKEDTNPLHIVADVHMLSGCEDSQTSADAQNARMGQAGGAMTTSFCNACREGLNGVSYNQLLGKLDQKLKGKYTQRPVLTSSQAFDLNQQYHMDSIHMNGNPALGQFQRKKFKSQKPDVAKMGPLGGMLGPMFGMVGFGASAMAFNGAAGSVMSKLPSLMGGFFGGGGGDRGDGDGGGGGGVGDMLGGAAGLVGGLLGGGGFLGGLLGGDD